MMARAEYFWATTPTFVGHTGTQYTPNYPAKLIKINADSCTLKSGCALTRSVAATLASFGIQSRLANLHFIGCLDLGNGVCYSKIHASIHSQL